MRLGWIGLALALLPLSACSDEPDPMQLGGYGNVLEPQSAPPYFTLDMCLPGGDALVNITDVQVDDLRGETAPIRFAVAFGDSEAAETISGPQPAPDGFHEAVGAAGAVPSCDGDESAVRMATLAVLFPPVGDEPVVVDGVTVTYEVDGDEHSAQSDAFLVQCPSGTRSGSDEGRPCRPAP